LLSRTPLMDARNLGMFVLRNVGSPHDCCRRAPPAHVPRKADPSWPPRFQATGVARSFSGFPYFYQGVGPLLAILFMDRIENIWACA